MTAPVRTLATIDDRPPRTLVAVDATRPLDIGEISDKDFERAVQIVEVRKKRIARILETFLIEGKHFGNPEVNGRKAFQKPILYQAGAEELRGIFGCNLVEMAPPVITESAEFVSVRVTIGVEDRNRTVLALRGGACTSKEKRFKRRDGKGFTYDDAREVLHDCLAMAEKRAGGLATRAAFGLTGYLGAEDTDDDDAHQKAEDARPLTPWTEAEKARVYDAARAKGLRKGQLKDLIAATLGSADVGTGGDVEKLMAAITAWVEPKTDTAPVDSSNNQGTLPIDDEPRQAPNALSQP